jgi:hypothetical protein
MNSSKNKIKEVPSATSLKISGGVIHALIKIEQIIKYLRFFDRKPAVIIFNSNNIKTRIGI